MIPICVSSILTRHPKVFASLVQGYERRPYKANVGGSNPSRRTKENEMPMYETTVRTPQGEVKDRVYARDLQEARQLFEQRHGPRNVPYIPKVIPS